MWRRNTKRMSSHSHSRFFAFSSSTKREAARDRYLLFEVDFCFLRYSSRRVLHPHWISHIPDGIRTVREWTIDSKTFWWIPGNISRFAEQHVESKGRSKTSSPRPTCIANCKSPCTGPTHKRCTNHPRSGWNDQRPYEWSFSTPVHSLIVFTAGGQSSASYTVFPGDFRVPFQKRKHIGIPSELWEHFQCADISIPVKDLLTFVYSVKVRLLYGTFSRDRQSLDNVRP